MAALLKGEVLQENVFIMVHSPLQAELRRRKVVSLITGTQEPGW